LHGGEVDHEPAALRGSRAERVAEAVGVAQVDLADSGHDGGAVGLAPGGKDRVLCSRMILAYLDGGAGRPGSMVTCCMRARISAMP